MKKLLSLSALILFSCSKDIIVPADSGNQIIGNYQLILQTSSDQEEFSHWGGARSNPVTDLTGKVSFSSNFKGYYDIIVEDENIRVNFDWSYDGSKWNLVDSESNTWVVTNSNRCVSNITYCTGEANSSGLYIMIRTAIYKYQTGINYKLVF
tara:strand:- start:513 stop:968 length:456 start_codon:yes stop_codon:yes gene_type:complete